jgi:hypothetical protein
MDQNEAQKTFMEHVKFVQELLEKLVDELDPGAKVVFWDNNPGMKLEIVVEDAAGNRLYTEPQGKDIQIDYEDLYDKRKQPEALKAILRSWGAGKSKAKSAT